MIYFVGAGLSIDAGVPGIAGLQDRIHDGFYWDRVHGKAYRAALEQLEMDPLLSSGRPAGRRESNVEASDVRLEELIDVLNSAGELPGCPRDAKPRLRRAVMATIGESLNLDGTNPGSPRYYVRLIRRAIRRGFPVHVFSANFDLGIELLALQGYAVETGFAGHGPEHRWERIRFLMGALGTQVFLYKMHGSLNWVLGEDGRLWALDPRGFKDIERAVVVLGKRAKEAGEFPEPYWFYRGLFLMIAVQARQILIIGYSFHDVGINAMLAEFAAQPECDRICVLSKFPDSPEREKEFARIRKALGGSNRVQFISGTAENLSRGDYDHLLCSGHVFPGA